MDDDDMPDTSVVADEAQATPTKTPAAAKAAAPETITPAVAEAPTQAPSEVPADTEAAPPMPPRPMSEAQKNEIILKEAFPSVDQGVIKAILRASGGQVEPAFNALLGMLHNEAYNGWRSLTILAQK